MNGKKPGVYVGSGNTLSFGGGPFGGGPLGGGPLGGGPLGSGVAFGTPLASGHPFPSGSISFSPVRALIGSSGGIVFNVFVPALNDIVLDVRWELAEVMLRARLTPESVYNDWVNHKVTEFTAWATFFGRGLIRGRFCPSQFSEPWIVLIDAISTTWPQSTKGPIPEKIDIYAVVAALPTSSLF